MLDRWDVSGLRELDAKLAEIADQKTQLRVLRKAGREAMTGVALTMAMGSGFDTDNRGGEHMRDSIRIIAKKQDRRGGRNNAVAVRVGPARKHSQKAIAQEYGTEKQSADPFIRPALYNNRHRIVSTFRTVLATEITKVLRKRQRAAARAAR